VFIVGNQRDVIDTEYFGESSNRLERRIGFAALSLGDIIFVKFREFSQLVLGQPALQTQLLEPTPELRTSFASLHHAASRRCSVRVFYLFYQVSWHAPPPWGAQRP